MARHAAGYVKWLNESWGTVEEKDDLEKIFGVKEVETPKMPDTDGGEVDGPKGPEDAKPEEPKEENPEEPKEEPKEEKPEDDKGAKYTASAKEVLSKDLEQFGYVEYLEKIGKGDMEAAQQVVDKGYPEVFSADDLESNEKIKKGALKAKEELGIE